MLRLIRYALSPSRGNDWLWSREWAAPSSMPEHFEKSMKL
jgi:hypothetical protein